MPSSKSSIGGGGGDTPVTLNEAILALGPTGYYRLNELSGTNVFDSSSSPTYNLEFYGSAIRGQPSLDASSADDCTDFDGASYIDFQNFAGMSGPYTVEFLMGPLSGDNQQRAFDFQDTVNHGIVFINRGSPGTITLYSGGNEASASIDRLVGHHIAAIFENGTMNGHKLFVDGVLVAQFTGSFNAGFGSLNRRFGCRRDQFGDLSNCAFDEIAVYSGYALTESEVQLHAQLAGY